MKSTALLLTAAFLWTFNQPVHAGSDGNKLLEQCSVLLDAANRKPHEGSPVETAYGGGFCTGFVQGIIYTSMVYERRPPGDVEVCIPDNLTNLQAAKALVRYLEQQKKEFPAMLELDANTLAIAALHTEYSCTKAGR